MRKTFLAVIALLLVVPMLFSCSQSGASFDFEAHRTEVLDWRAGRLERLTAPTGYLTLAGLFWLDVGTYTFGSDAANDVMFPPAAAARIGEFHVDENGISMSVADGVEVNSEGAQIQSILIADDTTDAPVTIRHRTLGWTAVKRDNRYAIRLRDFEHPALQEFGELPYYDIDPKWRVNATLRRYPEPRTVSVATVIEGLGWNPRSPGIAVFEFDGKSYELEAYESDDSLFYVFGDATSRDDTYGAGRFLYSDVPGDDGLMVLDFNKAYSPPCAFNDFATCPVASPRNRMAVRIEAGEKYEPGLHFASDH